MDIHTHPHLRPPRLLLPDLLVTVSCHAIPVVVPRIDDMDNDRPHNRVAILPCSAIIPHLRRTDRRSSWYSIHFEDVSIEFLLEVTGGACLSRCTVRAKLYSARNRRASIVPLASF